MFTMIEKSIPRSFNNLKHDIGIVLQAGDKFCVFILIICNSIKKVDKVISKNELLYNLIYDHLYKHELDEEKHLISNHYGSYSGTAKTHKNQFYNDITLEQLYISPIIDKASIYIYVFKFVAKYHKTIQK